MKVSMTLWQRMNLEGIIRTKRSGDGEDFMTTYEVWKKINVPENERKEYLLSPCAACGLGKNIDVSKIKLSETKEIEIEKAEGRKLMSLLQEWKQFSVDDAEWLIPLKQALSNEGALGT